MSLGFSVSPVFHSPAVRLTAFWRDTALEDDAIPFRRFWNLDGDPSLGMCGGECRVQREKQGSELVSWVPQCCWQDKTPSETGSWVTAPLDHRFAESPNWGKTSEAGSTNVWRLYPFVLGRGCHSAHMTVDKTEAREGQVIGKLNSEK